MNNANASLREVWVLLAQQLPSLQGGSEVRLGSADAWEEEEEETAAGNGSCLKQAKHQGLGASPLTLQVFPSGGRTCLTLAPWAVERLGCSFWPREMLRMGNLIPPHPGLWLRVQGMRAGGVG